MSWALIWCCGRDRDPAGHQEHMRQAHADELRSSTRLRCAEAVSTCERVTEQARTWRRVGPDTEGGGGSLGDK